MLSNGDKKRNIYTDDETDTMAMCGHGVKVYISKGDVNL